MLAVIHNPVTNPGSQDAGSPRWLLLTLADQGNTRQVHPQRLSAWKSGDEVVQKAGIAGLFLLSLTLLSRWFPGVHQR